MTFFSSGPRRGRVSSAPLRNRVTWPAILTVLLAALLAALLAGACSEEEEEGIGESGGNSQNTASNGTSGSGSTSAPAPDLRVEIEAVAHDAAAGTWLLFRISNLGDADSGAFDLDLFANLDEAPALGAFGDKFAIYAGLEAGGSFLDFMEITQPGLASGTAYAVVDTTGFIAESDEDNNIAAPLAWGDVQTPVTTLDFEELAQPEGLASVNSEEDVNLNWGFDQTSPAAAGAVSLVSGGIGHDPWSCLAYDPGAATQKLAFSRRVSTEADYDGMTLFMGEEQVFFWSGELGWERFTLSMPTAARTYTLCYVKDADTVEGEDAVWIDLLEVE